MRKLADSIILATANCAAYGISLLGRAFHLRLADRYGVAILPVAIVLLLLTLFFALRDLRRKHGLALAAPFAYYLFRPW
jgi:hypothetical protein